MLTSSTLLDGPKQRMKDHISKEIQLMKIPKDAHHTPLLQKRNYTTYNQYLKLLVSSKSNGNKHKNPVIYIAS